MVSLSAKNHLWYLRNDNWIDNSESIEMEPIHVQARTLWIDQNKLMTCRNGISAQSVYISDKKCSLTLCTLNQFFEFISILWHTICVECCLWFTSFNYVIILSYNDIGSVCTFYGIFSNNSWYILDRLCLLCWPLLNLARDFSHLTWNRTTLSCAALIIHYNKYKYKRKLSNGMITLELVFSLWNMEFF